MAKAVAMYVPFSFATRHPARAAGRQADRVLMLASQPDPGGVRALYGRNGAMMEIHPIRSSTSMTIKRYPWGTASPAARIRETSTKARNGLNTAAEALGYAPPRPS